MEKGDIVNFISPQDSDLNRYSAIYYFKDNPNLKLPNKIKITSNSYLRGYGFYNCYKSLRQDVLDTPPTFMPYEFLELPKTMEYLSNSIKKNSYIRLETEDYSFYKPDSKIIYIADYNAFRLDNLSNLLNDKDIKYYFAWPIICDTEECYESYKELTKNQIGDYKLILLLITILYLIIRDIIIFIPFIKEKKQKNKTCLI